MHWLANKTETEIKEIIQKTRTILGDGQHQDDAEILKMILNSNITEEQIIRFSAPPNKGQTRNNMSVKCKINGQQVNIGVSFMNTVIKTEQIEAGDIICPLEPSKATNKDSPTSQI